MPNKDEAEKAIAALNGKDVKGRTVTVNEAWPRTDRPRSGGTQGDAMCAAEGSGEYE